MNMLNLTFIAAAAALPSAVAFAPVARHEACSSTSALSYANANSDNDESNNSVNLASLAHQAAPPHLQPLPPPLLARIDAEDWKEWQYSFSRNGLTDFLPQFSAHISCLAIDVEAGQDDPARAISDAVGSVNAQIPWLSGDDSTETTTSAMSVPVQSASAPDDNDQQQGDPLSLFNESTSISKSGAFDCILDSGVMNSILSSLPSEVTWHSRAAPTALLDLAKLVSEANKAIREFGIYVAITEESIPAHARGYLDGMGEVMGMEWTFDLDGVSREDRYFVTVARKYRTGPVNLTGKGSGNLLRP
ncbi:hypothetical protein ACHAXT_010645 [Thalassiosira profunda]